MFGTNLAQPIVDGFIKAEKVDLDKIDVRTDEIAELTNRMKLIQKMLSELVQKTKESEKIYWDSDPEMQECIRQLQMCEGLENAFVNCERPFVFNKMQVKHMKDTLNGYISNVIGPEMKAKLNNIQTVQEEMTKKTDIAAEILKDWNRMLQRIQQNISQSR